MQTVLLTSNNLRHKYLAHQISENTDLQLVITEKKSPAITDTSGMDPADATFIDQHFKKRAASEEDYFGAYHNFPEAELLEVEHGMMNSGQVVERLKALDPVFILLFGTSIIMSQILNHFKNRVINFHLGLSPYYRGSATNLFPLYYNEPECIGATLHLASAEVDRGAILYQFRPEISKDDSLHDIGNKTILKGGKLLPKVLEAYRNTEIETIEQQGAGRVCKIKDLTPEKLQKIYQNIEQGLIEEYLQDKKRRDLAFKIVQPELL
ncbi:formyltransferase family protein [Salegentibacter flavus]|nr:formyltransferase family protein [Salegentibacter flavus]